MHETLIASAVLEADMQHTQPFDPDLEDDGDEALCGRRATHEHATLPFR